MQQKQRARQKSQKSEKTWNNFKVEFRIWSVFSSARSDPLEDFRMAMNVGRAPGFASMMKDGARHFSGIEEAVFRNIGKFKFRICTYGFDMFLCKNIVPLLRRAWIHVGFWRTCWKVLWFTPSPSNNWPDHHELRFTLPWITLPWVTMEQRASCLKFHISVSTP